MTMRTKWTALSLCLLSSWACRREPPVPTATGGAKGAVITATMIDREGACQIAPPDAMTDNTRVAIACATDFIRRNGYSDSAIELPVQLESHDPSTVEELNRKRNRTLEAFAFAVCSFDAPAALEVVYRTQDGFHARSVKVPSGRVGIRIVHQDFDLEALMAGRLRECSRL